MNFISNDLNLPLFLVSRNRLKFHHPGFMPKYISKYRNFLTRCCNEENETETATKAHLKHLVGLYPPSDDLSRCKLTSGSKDERSLINSKAWQLSPNLYDVPPELFRDFKGAGGAHWAKLPNPTLKKVLAVQKKTIKSQWKFYDLPREMEHFTRPCHKYKGIFLSNARARKPSTRFMVSDPATCYRFPNDPGPTHYVPLNHELEHGLRMARVKVPALNPHLFLRYSCVPVKTNSIHPKNTSFQPAPGRYENRFKGTCPCSCKRIYYPDIHLAIMYQKRLKFRRQPYRKIKFRRYCAPNWRHVHGRGHTYLFKESKAQESKKKKIKASKEAKKSEKTLQLYPDARYISMINNPTTYEPLSIRTDEDPYIRLPPTVRFDCIAKRIMRRQLRNNKKIAFNSGQKRFKDDVRPLQMSMKQLEEIKQSLPLERQLRDHPVSKSDISQIKSKLMSKPQQIMPISDFRVRKRLFKFSPLPGPKVLVTDKDTQPDTRASTPYKPEPFFGKTINPEDFLREGTTLFSIDPKKTGTE